jgi:hypothetical protein
MSAAGLAHDATAGWRLLPGTRKVRGLFNGTAKRERLGLFAGFSSLGIRRMRRRFFDQSATTSSPSFA